MKLLLIALTAALSTGAGGCAPASTSYGASGSVSYSSAYEGYDDDYGALDQYGTWVDVENYGEVWCPLEVDAEWRPYTVGSWAYTDYGWMWVAQDPWGAVPYHYGRWVYDSWYGWVWVPGDVWAPAWVSWRYGDGWVGWAPLPPDADWRIGIGFSVDIGSLDSRIDSYGWCFVPARDLLSPNIRTRLAPPSRNVTYLTITQNITNYTEFNSRPAERGLRPEMIERDLGRRLTPYKVVESDAVRGRREAQIRGQSIEIRRPGQSVGSKARERIRTQPPERTVPPPRMIQRQEAERQKFDRRMQSERARLQSEHQRELRQRPQGVSPEELTRRQQAEMQAQKEHEDRERRVIDERTRRLKERSTGQGRGNQGRGQGQGQGQDQNQGQGQGRDRDPNQGR